MIEVTQWIQTPSSFFFFLHTAEDISRNVTVDLSFIAITSQPRRHKKIQRRRSAGLKYTFLMSYGTLCSLPWIFAEIEMTILIFS